VSDLLTDAGATFSPCRTYRYRLWRFWDQRPYLAFVMLNPSTADEVKNDPTVERCERRARVGGYGGVAVVNLFAFRSTDPAVLRKVADPVGPHNDAAITDVAKQAGRVICAWGTHGSLHGRDAHVLVMLHWHGVGTYALRVSKGGHPCHPLYLPYGLEPAEFPPEEAASQSQRPVSTDLNAGWEP
jgi:hypothetical protein